MVNNMKRILLVVVVLALIGCSKEQVSGQKTTQPLSEEQMESAELYKNKWQYHQERNPIDDRFSAWTYVESDEPLKLDGIQTRPSLVLRCMENKFDIFFELENIAEADQKDFNSSNIVVRFDMEKAINYSMHRGEDMKTISFKQPVEMIDPLLKHNMLTMQFNTREEQEAYVSFDIRGLQYVISPLKKICKLN